MIFNECSVNSKHIKQAVESVLDHILEQILSSDSLEYSEKQDDA